MNKKYRLISSIFKGILVTSLFTPVMQSIVTNAASDSFENWSIPNDGVKKYSEDGKVVHQFEKLNSDPYYLLSNIENNATFDTYNLKVRIDSVTDSNNENLFFAMALNDGSNSIEFLFRRNGTITVSKGMYNKGELGNFIVDPLEIGKWNDLQISYKDGNFEISANGNLLASLEKPDNFEMHKATVGFGSWGVLFSVKDFSVENKNGITVPVDPDVNPDANWNLGSHWTLKNEGGDTVYKLSSFPSNLFLDKSSMDNFTSSFNTFEVDIRLDDITDSGNDNLFFAVGLQKGSSSVEFLTRINGNSAITKGKYGTTVTTGEKNDRLQFDKWYHFKAVFAEDYLRYYMDDKLILSNDSSIGFAIEKAVPCIGSWGAYISMKNMKVSSSPITYPAGYKCLDLEFNREASVTSCDGNNINLSYSNGKLIGNITNNNASIKFPSINVPAGHKYSMYLPLRNTLLVRMKNNTNASKLKVVFANSSTPKQTYEKEFDIVPNSDFKTYFFNVSDLNPSGYLRELEFQLADVTSGNIEIDAITFEREDPIYDYAGNIETCYADPITKKVNVKGKVKEKYNGKTVRILQSDPRNYNDSLSYSELALLATGTVEGGKFDITFDLYPNGSKTSLLSAFLLAEIDGVKVSKYFTIDNYEDYSPLKGRKLNIPENLVINVLDYGAKGDGFTDDTAAIQKAIDAVKASGGGKVIIPGDDSEYGKRYVVTHIKLCSNINFVIEENAMLWQSQREDELNKTVPVFKGGFNEVYYGFSVDMEGAIWSCGYTSVNKPLVFADHEQNVSISGKGFIRMSDIGGEVEDPLYFVGDPDLAKGQENRVQQIPLLIFKTEKVDVRDIKILRSSAWQAAFYRCNDVYVANVEEREEANVTCDGFHFTGSQNAVLHRCFNYTSDDAVVFNGTYRDPRSKFFYDFTEEEASPCKNITVSHCFLFGGFGTVFIPWGSEAPNLELSEIRNITVFDSRLGGHKSSGSWPDDPFYGTSSYLNNYTQQEDNDYAPITDVLYYDNTYLKEFNWSILGVTPKATNFRVLDDVSGTVYSNSEFLNGNFDKNVHKGQWFYDETEFETGLTYWSYKGNVSSYLKGYKQSTTVDTKENITQKDFAGKIQQNGELYQGLYETFGNYKFQVSCKNTSNTATIFARNSITGEIIASKVIPVTSDFENVELDFSVSRGLVVQLGVSLNGSEDDTLLIDNASISRNTNADTYKVTGIESKNDMESLDNFTIKSTGKGAILSNNSIVTPNDSEYKLILDSVDELSTFEISADFKVSDIMNCGFYLFAKSANNNQDGIYARNVQIERKENANSYTISIYKFDNQFNGAYGTSGTIEIPDSEYIHLRVVCKNSVISVFNDETSNDPLIVCEVPEGLKGYVGIRSQMAITSFTNLKIVSPEYKKIAKIDSTTLNNTINQFNRLNKDEYTKESYDKVKEIVNEIQQIEDFTNQEEVVSYLNRLNEAIRNLEKIDPDAEAKAFTINNLKTTLNNARELDSSLYTEDSYAQLKLAIQQANLLLQYPDSSIKQFEDMDENLKDKIAKLVKNNENKPSDDSSSIDKPSDDTNPSTPSKGCKGQATSSILGLITIVGALKLKRKKK